MIKFWLRDLLALVLIFADGGLGSGAFHGLVGRRDGPAFDNFFADFFNALEEKLLKLVALRKEVDLFSSHLAQLLVLLV